MCFDVDSSPPVPIISGAAVAHRDLTLRAGDGVDFAAFEATGEHSTGPAVVVLPDVRGLYRFYEELALRFAESGFDTVAIDYFGRTAGIGKRGDDFEYMPHVRQTTFEGVRADTAAAVAHLRSDTPDRAIFTVGFCFGGSNSWHQAAAGHRLSGAVGFYGNPSREGVPLGAPSAVSLADRMDCPILGLMGGADTGIPQSEIDRFDEALGSAGVDHELVTYPGAPHSFFDRKYEEFARESLDAWNRVLDFLRASSS